MSTSSARGQIYDSSGKPLVENTVNKLFPLLETTKMTATDLKETAKKLLAYVGVSSPTLTDRQLADYYLADQDVYKKAVESLPREKRLDSDGIVYPNQNSITMRSIVSKRAN